MVAQAHVDQTLLVQPMVHRQQADGCDAQGLQVADGRRMGQPGEAAPQRFGHFWVAAAEALDMHLIQHGVRQRRAQRAVRAPVKCVMHHAALERRGGVVTRVGLQGVVAIMAEMLGAPVEIADDVAGLRVEQQLAGIEPLALVGAPGAVGAKP